MIRRDAETELLKLADQFKAVAMVGPRQSGKTTLARHTFPHKPYINLENPDTRQFAMEDPRGFLEQYSGGAILDEAQRVPHLFSYLQQVLDENPTPGKFIITGSNNFLLQENISQSLAGRIGYLVLLPFAIRELADHSSIYNLMFKGFYPPVYDQPVESTTWYANYIRTYIERDVRQLKNIADLYVFERFVRLCAGRAGQLLNMSNLAIETGVDVKTISSWIGILESSFVIYRLQPHYQNFNKRVVKMPKLYFYDTGLAASLLGIQRADQFPLHPQTGALFENFILGEMIKTRYNRGMQGNLFFWRDNTGHEVDVLIETADKLYPVEIKAGQTITPEFFKGLNFWNRISGKQAGAVVYAGSEHHKRSGGIQVIPWNMVHEIDALLDA
jgi:predicted AAA+ superfamily ATPase